MYRLGVLDDPGKWGFFSQRGSSLRGFHSSRRGYLYSDQWSCISVCGILEITWEIHRNIAWELFWNYFALKTDVSVGGDIVDLLKCWERLNICPKY